MFFVNSAKYGWRIGRLPFGRNFELPTVPFRKLTHPAATANRPSDGLQDPQYGRADDSDFHLNPLLRLESCDSKIPAKKQKYSLPQESVRLAVFFLPYVEFLDTLLPALIPFLKLHHALSSNMASCFQVVFSARTMGSLEAEVSPLRLI
jgi:hypothetical protein